MFKRGTYEFMTPNLPGIIKGNLRFQVHFDRASPPPKCPVLEPYTKGTFHLSSKQVPSALALRSPGSSSVSKKLSLLLEEGFPLVGFTKPDKGVVVGEDEVCEFFKFSTVKQSTEKLVAITKGPPDNPETIWYHLPLEEDESREISHDKLIKIDYNDPFLVLAGRALVRARGHDPISHGLHTKVWFGDVRRLQDQVPSAWLSPEYTGKRDQTIKFVDISNPIVKKKFLFDRTFWGKRLSSLCSPKIIEELFPNYPMKEKKSLQIWASKLKGKIISYFSLESHPSWKREEFDKLFTAYKPSLANRSKRLLEVLKTVDGMFVQRYTAFPEEVWTWEKFDLFVLKNLDMLLDDEFLDGEVDSIETKTRYEELKDSRKLFKSLANRDNLLRAIELGEVENQLPKWLHHLIPIWERAMKQQYERKEFLLGLLSQTRGCGTPPNFVILKAKVKFIETVTDAPREINPSTKKIILNVLEKTIASVPDEVFTGLTTKARITITTSGCWETAAKEGGTLQTISELVNCGREGKPVTIIDLYTGEPERDATLEELSVGEYIFWACLEKVLMTDPEELRRAFLLVVKEPSKGRSVTKASAYLKVILDCISKICAWPLAKGFKTSKSGMLASSHGWNFFLQFFDKDEEEDCFEPIHRIESERIAGSHFEQTTYRDIFIGSTDFRTATDFMDHWLARVIGTSWMKKCGIPPILQMVVLMTSFEPREIHFIGKGYLSRFGEPTEDESIRKVVLRKGVLMGDPLTKIILHIVNILIRKTSELLGDDSFCNEIWPDGKELRDELFAEESNPTQFHLKTEPGEMGPEGYLIPKSPLPKRVRTPHRTQPVGVDATPITGAHVLLASRNLELQKFLMEQPETAYTTVRKKGKKPST